MSVAQRMYEDIDAEISEQMRAFSGGSQPVNQPALSVDEQYNALTPQQQEAVERLIQESQNPFLRTEVLKPRI